jgi:hypothetical protein
MRARVFVKIGDAAVKRACVFGLCGNGAKQLAGIAPPSRAARKQCIALGLGQLSLFLREGRKAVLRLQRGGAVPAASIPPKNPRLLIADLIICFLVFRFRI